MKAARQEPPSLLFGVGVGQGQASRAKLNGNRAAHSRNTTVKCLPNPRKARKGPITAFGIPGIGPSNPIRIHGFQSRSRVTFPPSRTTTIVALCRMSSSLLSSLPSYNGLSIRRIQSLYSDISRQKHSNPTTYNSNLTWWHSTLETIVSRGRLLNTSDRLILRADQTLLDTLRYEGVGKPLCLGTVIVCQFLCTIEM